MTHPTKQTMKKMIASLALSALTITSLAFASPAHANPSWDGAGKTFVQGDHVFVPVRDLTKSFSASIEWVPYGEINLLVFTDSQGQAYEISLNLDTGLAQSYQGFYPYTCEGGSVSLPVQFFKDHYQNLAFDYEPTSQRYTASLIQPEAGLSFTQLNPYVAPTPVAEAAPAPAPAQTASYFQSGQASYYGPGLNGNYTASGEIFNMYDMTAAHKTLPFGTLVKVTNQANGASCVVRINDRGPYAHGRVIDLSLAAADAVGMRSSGVAPVTLELLS